nr:MAG TPA: Dec protein, OB-Fold, Decoration, VIRAL PROTEIN [Bacteriophage sp.]
MLKITEDISYAALFKNNAKVGDIVQLEGAIDFIIFSASMDNSSFMSLLQGSTSDINTYNVYYDDSTQLYIFDEDGSLSIANNNNINSIVRSYVEDTYITEKTLEKLPAGTNASITATDSILNAFAKLQGQVNAKANTSSIPTAATVTPKASGTAAVGTSTKYAREDHVHPLQTNVETATKLATPRVIAIAGAVSGSATFDGSGNVSINSTLNNFDASKITSGTLNADRLPEIPISKIPAAAMERLYVVDSQSAAMSLTIQEGDVVQIGSGGPMYFCVSESASTFATKFKVFTAGAATSVPWSGVTGAPTLSLRSLQVNAVGYQVYSNVATSIPMIYAPTEIGTSGQILQSTGNGAPKWVNQSAITAGQANQVLNPFVLKINNGSAEDTSVYTFNGSAGKVLNFVSGSNIILTPTQNKLTISAYIPVATSSTYGGIQIGYTTEDKNYAVQLSHGKAYVNVP